MAKTLVFSLLLCSAGAIHAQDPNPKKGGGTIDTKYENAELGLTFTGVYGWEKIVATGNAAWTELARYTESAFDADVVLLVRDNPFAELTGLRNAMKEEFAVGDGDVKPGETAYKDIELRDAKMARGLGLPAVEVTGGLVRITKEGKKRELAVISRTYYGANRLFRVHCTVRKSRLRRVKDLLERATAGLIVRNSQEKVVAGYAFVSERGKYRCLVPAEFTSVLPPRNARADMRFGSRTMGVTVSVWAYTFEGILADHVEEMVDYYGDALKMENEETKALGGDAFTATLTKGDKVTLIVGSVQKGRVYRIHTSGKKSKMDDLERAHAAFVKSFKAQK